MTATKSKKPNPLRFRYKKDMAEAEAPHLHIYRGHVCETDKRGYPTPQNRSPLELVVDATEGFIPLWGPDVTLRWRFQDRSLAQFRDPEAAKAVIRAWFAEGLLLWGDAVPVRFQEAGDAWDFELVVRSEPNCSPSGCTLARAFFPDSGQHDLVLFPTLFDETEQEIVETMAHELGHIFGLRHFFAQITETAWASEIFGAHVPFSIMNYGDESVMTETDREDLKTLYAMAWSGDLTEINGTAIRLMRPFSEFRHASQSDGLLALA